MPYRILADTVVIVHFSFIVFVAVGALLAWRWPGLVSAHAVALAWGVGTVIIGFPCPLTALEKGLRSLAGDQAYAGGFIDHYLEGVVYPGQYTWALRGLVAVAVLVGYVGLSRRRMFGETPNPMVYSEGEPQWNALSAPFPQPGEALEGALVLPLPRPSRRTDRSGASRWPGPTSRRDRGGAW